MKKTFRLAVATSAVALTAAALAVPAASADSRHGQNSNRVVFVQTDNTSGNQIVAYTRAADGTLSQSATYDTGGLGGRLGGAAVDYLASQGSLTFNADHKLLFAVNAGSNSISVFRVHGSRLALEQVISSGGSFPASITVHDDVVYVLNALDGGSIQGYRLDDGRLRLVPGWNRPLNLDPNAAPQFTHTPGQVIFAPDGKSLLVTTKANTHAIDVFSVKESGRPANTPVVNVFPGTVPFAGTFDGAGHFLAVEVGIGSVVSYALTEDGTLTALNAVATTQVATCWIAAAGGYFYTGNAGGNGTPGFGSLSGIASTPSGVLTNLGATTTDPGTVDAAGTSDGKFLYTQTGAHGIVDEFAINADGSLSPIGSVTVPSAIGGEGIVAL